MHRQASVAFSVQGHCRGEAGSAVSEKRFQDGMTGKALVLALSEPFICTFNTCSWENRLFSGPANLCNLPTFYSGDTIAILQVDVSVLELERVPGRTLFPGRP